MNKEIPRRVVVITGATAGVGRAAAIEFARTGACIGLLARGEDRLKDAVGEIERLGGRSNGHRVIEGGSNGG